MNIDLQLIKDRFKELYCEDDKGFVLNGDSIELLKNIPDKSIDLVCIDPPYNVNKAEWDKIDNYIEWMGHFFKETQRVLKENGSFYFFHNDFFTDSRFTNIYK